MLHSFKTLISASCFVLAGFSAAADDTTDPNQVVATVNGTDITLAHIIAIRSALPQQYNEFPSSLLFQGIVDQLIQHTLLMQSQSGDPSFKTRVAIENETRALIAGDVMNGVLSDDPTEADVRALYDERFPPDLLETEYRAAHILVETEQEAQELVSELDSGADFAALAREKSTGPSSTSGGDLGWFGAGDMVDTFFAAVLELSPGELSPPVQTNFGWHVIRLAETRERERPDFATVQDQLIEEVRQVTLEEFISGLRAKAKITRADTEGFDPEIINNSGLLEN